MATPAVHNQQFSELLRCPVCIDVFSDPRTLPCLHTFCYKCIADWCKDKQSYKASCPECRQEFVIPGNGIDGLRKNFFFTHLLSMNEVKLKTEKMCEVCPGPKKKSSQMFCLQCEQSFCQSCSIGHSQVENYSLHELMSLDELQSDVDIHKKCRRSFCDKHTDKEIGLYCLEDKEVICVLCRSDDHQSHRCEEIPKFADDFRAGKWKHDLQTAISDIEKNLKVLNSKKLGLRDKVNNVETQIREEADQRIRMITSHKQKLISELHVFKANHEQEIDKLTRDFAHAKSLLTRFTNYCEIFLKEGSDLVICREADSVRRQTNDLANLRTLKDSANNLIPISVTFAPSSWDILNAKSGLGVVKKELTPTLAHTLVFDQDVVALAQTEDELFVLLDNKLQQVLLYDSSSLQFKRAISIPQLTYEAPSIAACPINNLLFVADFMGRCVHRVDLSTDVVTRWEVLCPCGLSMNEKDNIILSSRGDSGEVIREYSPTGTLLREVEIGDFVVRHVVETEIETFVVSSCLGQVHGVAELSSDGKLLRSYGKPTVGSGPGQMDQPRFLSVTSDGTVLIVDGRNDRILVLDYELTSAHALRSRFASTACDVLRRVTWAAVCRRMGRTKKIVGI